MKPVNMKPAQMILLLAAALAAPLHAAPITQASYADIAKLPDWSGYWMLSDKSGGEAGNESYAQDKGTVPLTPAYAQKRLAARDARAQENLTYCLPAGPTGVVEHGLVHQYLFTPGLITMVFEDGELRRIHMDGRPHRPLSQLEDSYMGDSIGHWEGATLVVDTIGFPHGSLFQNFGVTATLHTHLVEHIFKNPTGQMQIDAVMTDPKIFTQPWKFTRTFQPASIELEEPSCKQGNRDTGDSLDLTPPPEEN